MHRVLIFWSALQLDKFSTEIGWMKSTETTKGLVYVKIMLSYFLQSLFFYSAKKALESTFDFISDSPKLVLLTAYFTFIISFFLVTQLIQIIFTFVRAKWQNNFSPRHPPQSFSLQIVCCSKITRSVLCY